MVVPRNEIYTKDELKSTFEIILRLVDGTIVAKENRYWYRICENVITSEEGSYKVVTTPEREPSDAAMLDMPDSAGTSDGAEPANGTFDCDHHGLVKIDAVVKGNAGVRGQTTILKLGANYYKNSTEYGTGSKTVLQAIQNGTVVER